MAQKINYYWRVFATGFSFTIFGLGGVLIGCIVLPLILIFIRDKKKRQIIAQYLIHLSFKFFIGIMVSIGILTYEVEGADKLLHSEKELVVANHPTLLDVVFLISLMPKVDCVVKEKLWKNPFTRGPLTAANYILNAEPEKLVDDCVYRIDQYNSSIIIFPEGTRTAKGQKLGIFQRGVANIALRTNAQIRPVLISCNPTTLTKNEKWHNIPNKPFHITIKVLEPLSVASLVDINETRTIAVRKFNIQLRQFFLKQMENI